MRLCGRHQVFDPTNLTANRVFRHGLQHSMPGRGIPLRSCFTAAAIGSAQWERTLANLILRRSPSGLDGLLDAIMVRTVKLMSRQLQCIHGVCDLLFTTVRRMFPCKPGGCRSACSDFGWSALDLYTIKLELPYCMFAVSSSSGLRQHGNQ